LLLMLFANHLCIPAVICVVFPLLGMVIGVLGGSGLNLPASTFWNAGQFVPILLNCLRIGCCSNGVMLACENH